jgi:hypothetical protein
MSTAGIRTANGSNDADRLPSASLGEFTSAGFISHQPPVSFIFAKLRHRQMAA